MKHIYQRSCCRAVNTEGVRAQGLAHDDATDLCVCVKEWRGCREGVGAAMQPPSCEISNGPLGEERNSVSPRPSFTSKLFASCLFTFLYFLVLFPTFFSAFGFSFYPQVIAGHRVYLFVYVCWGGGGVIGVI